ncbi:arylsulfatase [Pseudomonadota bacterium]|nr:arylsulfatase [Pseudomonadota bacterium]
MKNKFLLIASIFFTSYGFPSPNIVIILADDLGWNDVSYHGSEIKTPNIDKLISSGVELDRFYVQPTCSPTRAELMTGKSAMRLGITRPISKNQKLGLGLEEKILPQYLKELNYSTYLLGKWHLGSYIPDYFPTRRGFDYFYGYLTGGIGYWDHIHGGGHDWQRNEVGLREDGYVTQLIKNDTLKIIDNHDFTNPIFLNVNFGAPHIPNEAPEESVLKFSYIENETRRIHAAMVHEMDNAIGEIIAALEKENVLKNTIVMFASDNGGLTPDVKLNPSFLSIPKKIGVCDTKNRFGIKIFQWICENYSGGSSNKPLPEGKMSVSEGGIRVPAVIWWPGKFEYSKSENFITMMDVLPTILDLINYKNEIDVDGVSRVSSLNDSDNSESSKYIVTNIINDKYAVIEMPYKLITSADGDQLYNILDDPSENLNIASENQEIVLELKNTLSQWQFGENRSLPISAVFKDPDLFGGEEDRIPWIEKAFENAESK